MSEDFHFEGCSPQVKNSSRERNKSGCKENEQRTSESNAEGINENPPVGLVVVVCCCYVELIIIWVLPGLEVGTKRCPVGAGSDVPEEALWEMAYTKKERRARICKQTAAESRRELKVQFDGRMRMRL